MFLFVINLSNPAFRIYLAPIILFLSSQLRSSAIATYAICGFANPGSLGILIGMITVICPEKQRMAATVGIRAFIAGSFVNFLNASIAGLYNYFWDNDFQFRPFLLFFSRLSRRVSICF